MSADIFMGAVMMKLSSNTRKVVFLILSIALICGAAITFAVAQSGRSVFNLNSPVSFPVDI